MMAHQVDQRVCPLRRWRWVTVVCALLLALVLGCVVWAERAGWPWLAAPLAKLASSHLQRPVVLGPDARHPQAAIHFWGSLRFDSPRLQIGPRPTEQADLLLVEGLSLRWQWSDVWQAWRGGVIRLDHLVAQRLAAHLVRDAQGRGNWALPADPAASAASAAPAPWPGLRLGRLKVDQLDVRYDDAGLALSTRTQGQVDLSGQAGEASAPQGAFASGLIQADTQGRYGRFPLAAQLRSTAVAEWMVGGQGGAWPFVFKLTVGRARLDFDGQVDGLSSQAGVRGRFNVSGPSLAAVGEPLGLVLPTTAAFAMSGTLQQQGALSRVEMDRLVVGKSRLSGVFAFDRQVQPPRLHGRLAGARLDVADLGPAIGASAQPTQATTAAPSVPDKRGGRVLPQRTFNLPALSMMDADVVVALDNVELRDGRIGALAPLRTHLTLLGGVLTLDDLVARTARGTLSGRVALDGRDVSQALWQADVRWQDVVLQEWVPALAPPGRAPYLAGQLSGQLALQGRGRSTADILASLNGQVRIGLAHGQMSHLVVEAAGLDLAQGLGVWVSGDRALPLTCARVDVDAKQGVLHARRIVFDTGDSLMRVMGQVSLRDERLALEAKVSPKDVSPLALRTPIQVTGTLGAPQVSIQVRKLVPRLAGAVALGLINPLAAIVPLIDLGDPQAKADVAQGCTGMVSR